MLFTQYIQVICRLFTHILPFMGNLPAIYMIFLNRHSSVVPTLGYVSDHRGLRRHHYCVLESSNKAEKFGNIKVPYYSPACGIKMCLHLLCLYGYTVTRKKQMSFKILISTIGGCMHCDWRLQSILSENYPLF